MKNFAPQSVYWPIDCHCWRDQWFWLRLLNVEIVFSSQIYCSTQFSRRWTSCLFDKIFQIFNCLFYGEKIPLVEFLYFQIQFWKGANSTIWHLNWVHQISSVDYVRICWVTIPWHAFAPHQTKMSSLCRFGSSETKGQCNEAQYNGWHWPSCDDIVICDAVFFTCSSTCTNCVQADWWAVEFLSIYKHIKWYAEQNMDHITQSFELTLLKLRW